MWFCWVLTWQHSAHLQYHEPDLRLALFVVKSCKRNSWGDFCPPGFQLYPCCPGWGLVWGIPPIQARVTHFPRPCTHMWQWGLGFQRDLNWLVLPAFGGVVLLGNPGGSSRQALLSTWSSGFFTSTAWQGAELGELDRVSLVILGLHTESNWSVLLSVCTGNPAVVASHDCRTLYFNDQCRRVIVILSVQ